MTRLFKRLSALLLLASASLFYLPLTARVLWDSDEGRYAEIAREMLELKDWITPHLNYGVYFEKPPLLYWLTALSLSLFGMNAFAARFWCATFGVLTVGLTYLIGKHWKSERCGLLAGSIVATSLFFFVLTQFLVLDMALTFWMTLSLYAASRFIPERSPNVRRRFAILFAVAAAGGLLTKGPIAVVLPGVIVMLTVFYTRLGSQIKRTPWKESIVVFVLLSAPWFLAVSLRHPYFASFFFIHEHIARYLTTVHHRTAPVYFFIPILLAGFLPWSVFLPAVFRYWLARRGAALKRDAVGALLLIWVVFIFLFFSLSQSKLPPYILPLFPALALLTAAIFDEAFSEERLPGWMRGGIIALIALFVTALWIIKWPHWVPALNELPASLAIAQSGWVGLLLGLGVLVFVGIGGMRRTVPGFGGILLVHVLLWSSVASLASSLDAYYSTQRLGAYLREQAQPQDRIVGYGVSYDNRLQTLAFYARRRIVVFGDAGELSLGLSHDPEASQWLVSETAADDAFRQMAKGTWVVTDEEHWNHLVSLGLSPAFERVMDQGRLRLLHHL
ncbi:MAG: phospholipid carrier-dependent glycosyltransferase [Elusimicrobiota bacterium]|jgi:4-amino-4-deoxy-L-arabinose transferase-like glycosyltransferase